jgi:hypothetical protein
VKTEVGWETAAPGRAVQAPRNDRSPKKRRGAPANGSAPGYFLRQALLGRGVALP